MPPSSSTTSACTLSVRPVRCRCTRTCRRSPEDCSGSESFVNEYLCRWLVFADWNTRKFSIRYDTVYLTCSKKLADSQLSLPHEMNKKCKKKDTKNIPMSVVSPVQPYVITKAVQWVTRSSAVAQRPHVFHVCLVSFNSTIPPA